MKLIDLVDSTYFFLVRWFSDGLIGLLMGVFTSIAIGILVSKDSQIDSLAWAASLSLFCVLLLIPIMVIRNQIQNAVNSIQSAASTRQKWTAKTDLGRYRRKRIYLGSFAILVLCTSLATVLLSLGNQERSRQEQMFLNSIYSRLQVNQKLSENIISSLPNLEERAGCHDQIDLLQEIRLAFEQLRDKNFCEGQVLRTTE